MHLLATFTSPLLLSIVKDKQGDEHNNKRTAEDCKNKFSENVLQQWTVTP